MAQKVQDISSDEIIDEKTILKEAEKREKEVKAEAKIEKEEEKKLRHSAKSKSRPKGIGKVKKNIRRKPKHGKKYREALKGLEKDKKYEISEAIALIKSQKIEGFDATIQLTVSLDKTAENVRGSVNLPGGAVKAKKIEIVDEKNIEDVVKKIKAGKDDFDILIASTKVMPKLGQIAKILGPKGLMPNPKSGTVTEDSRKVAEEFKGGKVEFKADKGNNVHIAIAKVSYDDKKIVENIQAVLAAVPMTKVRNVFLSRSMGPSTKIQL